MDKKGWFAIVILAFLFLILAVRSITTPEPAPQPESVTRAEFQEEIKRVDGRIDGVKEGQDEIQLQLDGMDDKLDKLITNNEETVTTPPPQPSQVQAPAPVIIYVSSQPQPYSSSYQQQCQPRYSSGQFRTSLYEEGAYTRYSIGLYKDSVIDYHWDRGPGDFNLKKCSLDIEGNISIPEDGNWRFFLNSDDQNAQLYVNNQRVYNDRTISLNKGDREVRVKYSHDGGGDAHLSLKWKKY